MVDEVNDGLRKGMELDFDCFDCNILVDSFLSGRSEFFCRCE